MYNSWNLLLFVLTDQWLFTMHLNQKHLFTKNYQGDNMASVFQTIQAQTQMYGITVGSLKMILDSKHHIQDVGNKVAKRIIET